MIRLADHCLWPRVTAAETAAVQRVLERGIFSGPFAPESRAFEAEFAAFVGAEHAWLTSSGTSALVLALAAAGIGEGDEVLMPGYGFIATAMATLQVGAVPLFADVDPVTGLMDPAEIDTWASPRTRAVVPVHIHGCPADLDAIGAAAERHGLAVVEDAAQAHGATLGGRRVGALGHGGAFSLQSSKNLAVGEGGVYVTRSAAAYELAGQVRNFGQDLRADDGDGYDLAHPLDGGRAHDVVRLGAMMRGNELAAALARAQLERLEAVTRAAQDNAARLSARLAELPGVTPPVVPAGRESVHHKYRVAIDAAAAGLAPLDDAAASRAVAAALRETGVLVAYWEQGPQSAFELFQQRHGFGRGWPFTNSDAELLRENYRVERFRGVQTLLDRSFLLFSQSYPLIAQPAALVDAYADAFERVWSRRSQLRERP